MKESVRHSASTSFFAVAVVSADMYPAVGDMNVVACVVPFHTESSLARNVRMMGQILPTRTIYTIYTSVISSVERFLAVEFTSVRRKTTREPVGGVCKRHLTR